MALDAEERRIATLLAAFKDIQSRMELAAQRFEQSVESLEPVQGADSWDPGADWQHQAVLLAKSRPPSFPPLEGRCTVIETST